VHQARAFAVQVGIRVATWKVLVADQPTCLCILSGERLRGSVFVDALRESLRPHDQLEIIVDRRCGEPLGEWERAEDRRRRPQVDLALRTNGFAVVPASGSAPGPSEDRTPLSRLLPSAPGKRLAYDAEDEERLEAIRDFKRGRSSGPVPWLVAALVVVTTAVFLLSPTSQALKSNLVHRLSPEEPGPSKQPAQTSSSSTATQGPAVAEKPSATTTEPVPPRDTNAVALPRESSTPPAESGAAPRATTGTDIRVRPGASDVVRPSASQSAPRQTASAPPSPEVISRSIAPRFAGLPRVELIREGNASSGVYAVRLADPAGKPLSDAEVLLIARMADGTLENVRMGFVPEQGTYRGILPPVRSAPVDLRIRVITGDKRVEIPVGP